MCLKVELNHNHNGSLSVRDIRILMRVVPLLKVTVHDAV